MSRPDNVATNACRFLCLGIIDRSSSEDSQTFDMEQFAAIVESINLDFSREVNKVHDQSMMPDIREYYDILSKNKLLRHVFDFTEIGIQYLIVCALAETEDHINSFQVEVHSPCHLRTSENLWFLIFLGG